ncbi:MAG: HAMP domain-containing sensor histidine kinase [Hyphomicrobiales bacterium]
MAKLWRLLPLAVILGASLAVCSLLTSQWHEARNLAREEYVAEQKANTRTGITGVERAVASIYENLRTLSSLPAVRAMDRHATNLTPEAVVTIQQIYNNLASSVAVSEVYFLPIDFDPKKLDPVTGKGEEPAIMFDELVLNAGLKVTREERMLQSADVRAATNNGPPEVESFEYTQLADHAAWLKANFPDIGKTGPLKVPFVAGPEVITCDNTHFITTHKDKDRSGIIFTVPVYGTDGAIRGMVSAIILTSALSDLLRGHNFALVNAANDFAVSAPDATLPKDSAIYIRKAEPDPGLVYSEVLPLGVKDARHPWSIWSGQPNALFLESRQALLADKTYRNGLLVLVIAASAALAGWQVANAFVRNSRNSAEQARNAEAEAQKQAAELQRLNDDVNRLNQELAAKMKALQEAQEDIIRQGRMAQLGQLIATVAHEIRNPLGGIRTSAFLLRRILRDPDPKMLTSLDRIDNGIKRCDDIITQLLDYSRSSPPQAEETDLDAWVLETVNSEAKAAPDIVRFTCDLGTYGQLVDMDRSRLHRAVANLIGNAYEAMMSREKIVMHYSGRDPSITVSTRLSARGAEISVADNGPGMAADVLARVRDPLYTTKSFGTGLGVPTVEKTAQLHGGGLDIVSEPAVGSTFTLWIPCGQTSAELAA